MHPSRKRFFWKVAVLAGGLWFVSQFVGSINGSRSVVQVAPLLEKVQALGELHAVKYTYRDVHEYETSREPTGVLASLPGGAELVQASTRNTALMSFTGTVEAGVDLSQAKIEKSAAGVTVKLPAPEVYPANVSADVHELKRGLFWRDQGIATEAIEDAKVRFRATSIRQGILKEARANIEKQVSELAGDLAGTKVAVVFEDDVSTSAKG